MNSTEYCTIDDILSIHVQIPEFESDITLDDRKPSDKEYFEGRMAIS